MAYSEIINEIQEQIDELTGGISNDKIKKMADGAEKTALEAKVKQLKEAHEAYKKNVLLISPTNLIAALRLIVDMWDRDKQSKNAEEIAERGGKLYEKFVGFLQSMEEIGASLKKSQGSYDKAISQLSEGRGNLVNQAKQLEHLGIKYNKSKQKEEK